MRQFSLCFAVLIGLAGAARAAEPVMTYQGRLKESGIPAADTRYFSFSFCALESGGSCAVTPSGTQPFQVTNGLFRSTFTVPAVDLAAGPWYLQVSVGVTASVVSLEPRERLTAIPYSVYASTADYSLYSATAAYAAGAVRRTGDIMTGQFTVSGATLTVNSAPADSGEVLGVFTGSSGGIGLYSGNIRKAYLGYETAGSNFVTGTLADSSVLRAAGALHLVSGDLTPLAGLTLSAAGNVGISTSMPLHPLHIVQPAGTAADILVISTGNAVASADVFKVTGAGDLYARRFHGDGTALTGVTAGSFSGSLAGDVTGTQGNTNVADNSHMHSAATLSGVIFSTAAIVASTGALQAGLDTVAADTTTLYNLKADKTAVVFSTGAAMTGQLVMPLGTEAAPSAAFGGAANSGIYSLSSGQLGFTTSGTSRLVIGASSITASLPYKGSTGSQANPSFSFSTDPATGMYLQGDGLLGFTTTGVEKMRITQAGRIGVGTTLPVSKFDVADGSITVRGANAALVFEDQSRAISSETAAGLGAGIRVSTNVYIVGFSSASVYYGSGAGLTGVPVAAVAGNLGGGAANKIPYQTGENITAFVDAPGSGMVLSASGGAPFWNSTPAFSGVNVTGIPQGAVNGLVTDLAAKAAAAEVAADTTTLQGQVNNKANDNAVVHLANTETLTGAKLFSNSVTVLDAQGVAAAQVRMADNVAVSSETSAELGKGVRVSTNVYVMGFSSAAKYYGDGSALVNLPVPAAAVQKAGDTMSGPLFVNKSGAGSFLVGTMSAGAALNFNLTSDKARIYTSNSAHNLVLGAGTDILYVKQSGIDVPGSVTGGTMTVAGSAFSVGGSTFAVTAGKIGVGTAQPASKLTVALSAGEGPQNGVAVIGRYNLLLRGGDTASGSMVGLALHPGTDTDPNTVAYAAITGKRVDSGHGEIGFVTNNNGEISQRLVVAPDGRVGVGAATPVSQLDVNGGSITVRGDYAALVFEDSARTISSETAAGVGAGIRVSTNIYIVGFSSAAKYYGDGSGLSNLPAASGAVSKSGDIMSGPLQTTTITVTGNAFSVGSSTFVVKEGQVGIGTADPAAQFQVQQTSAGYVVIISSSDGGGILTVSSDGRVEMGSGTTISVGQAPLARLSVQSHADGAGELAQVWKRSSDGVTVASMSATGVIYADGSGIRNIAVSGDNLGSHNAAQQLNMGGYAIWSSSSVTAAYYQIDGNTVLAVLHSTGSLGVGFGAGMVSEGINNTFVGTNAGYNNTSGLKNTVMGMNAGYYNQAGSANAIFGYRAGGIASNALNSFSSSTLVGYLAGTKLAAGSADNAFFGFRAGANVTVGTGNIIVGYQEDTSAPGANNELNIGGVLYGDLSAKTIGISTRNPQAALDIVSTGTAADVYAQIWRDSGGVVLSSMSATGVMTAVKFYGDGTSLVLPAAGGGVLKIGDTMTGPLVINADEATDSYTLRTNGVQLSTSGSVVTMGLGNGTQYPGPRGLGAVDLQTSRGNAGHVASGDYAVIGGGIDNTAANTKATVSGGFSNTASGMTSVVSGGNNNTAANNGATVAGGANNSATGSYATASGGLGSMAKADYATVSGGLANAAYTYATVPGGSENTAKGYYSFAAGFRSSSTADGTFTWSDSAGIVTDNNVQDRTVFKNRGGFLVTGSTGTVMQGTLDRGVFITGGGAVGIAAGAPQAALDVVSTGTASDVYAQIWRDSTGLAVASMTANGRLTTLQTLPGDNLGSHTGTQVLQMGAFGVNTSSAVSAAQYQIGGAGVLVISQGSSLGVGIEAGKVNAATNNTFMGYTSGKDNSSGGNNSFYGAYSGRSNTTAADNTFLGAAAGAANTGSYNSFMGSYAGNANTSGASNTYAGYRAGFSSTSGTGNLLLGSQAGYALTTASGNIFLGYSAGNAATTGGGNIVIGYGAQTSAPGAVNELNIGGVLYGDLAARTIGISTRIPQAALDVVSTGTASDVYAQIWRDSTGLAVASMSASGRLSTLQANGDNLGSHLAAANLDMGNNQLVNAYRVGIGTAIPGKALEVVGVTFIPEIRLRSGYYGTYWDIGGNNSLSLNFIHTGSTRGSFSSTGDFSIGMGNPDVSARLEVGGGSVTVHGLVSQPYVLQAGDNGVIISTGGAIQTIGKGHGETAGDPRGMAAVDLQTARASASQVASGDYSVISGGRQNIASGPDTVVAGGYGNHAFADYAAVGGGSGNTANSNYSVVAGGSGNFANNYYSFVGGGYGNAVDPDGNGGAIVGGTNNAVYGAKSSVGGGIYNIASGSNTVISGGAYNVASGTSAVVAGGENNKAAGKYSFAAGHGSLSAANGAFTWTDSEGLATENSAQDRTVFKNRGGFLVTGSTNTVLNSAADRGVFITGNGLVGISTGSPQAALDIVSTGTALNDSAQIWRDSNGVVVASMTATGVLYSAVSAPYYQVGGSTVLAVLPGATSLGVGKDAGRLNSGGNNSYIGYQAGYNNSTGYANSFVGAQAGFNNSSGITNSFLGTYAGLGNTIGAANSFVGVYAGYLNQTGSANSIVGYAAGMGTGGSYSSSTLLGYNAGYGLTTGNGNIFLGYRAGYNVTSGTGNIVIGYSKGTPSSNTDNYLSIGGAIYGDLATGKIGIGEGSPRAMLHVATTPAAAGVYDIFVLSTGAAAAQDVLRVATDGTVRASGPLSYKGMLPLRFTRATSAANGGDATKDAACAAEFGAHYMAAKLIDLAANMGGGSISGTYFTAAGNTNFGSINTYVADGGGNGGFSVACISRTAPLLFTVNLALNTAVDADKNATCAGDFGAGYMAATLFDVIAVSRAGGAATTAFQFNPAGTTTTYGYNNGPAIAAAAQATTRVPCIRVP